MANTRKTDALQIIEQRFGKVSKLSTGTSLFSVGNDAARIYFRYSKVHSGGRGFFGLREIDLRQLESHNSYICFLMDDNSLPVFVPFADFEEVFRQAKPAADGQYKVQLSSRTDGLELYVAKQGRFNVEGYIGFEILDRSVRAADLRPKMNLSHSQVQTLLAGIGHLKGYQVFVPPADVAKLDWSLTKQFRLTQNIPAGFERVRSILSEIDVTWLTSQKNRVEALFEVEHTTTIYSGLLRLNDLLLTEPTISRLSIVANESRRSVFAHHLFRPTFRKSGLSEITSFLEYSNVFYWHHRLTRARAPALVRATGST